MSRASNFDFTKSNSLTILFGNNCYQKVLDGLLPETVNAKAQKEFDTFVTKLRKAGVNVTVVEDTLEPNTPDSIYTYFSQFGYKSVKLFLGFGVNSFW